MIDSGCTDHLLLFKDDFAHLGNQIHYAVVANRQRFLCIIWVRFLFSQKINKQNLLFSQKCGMLHMQDTDFCLYPCLLAKTISIQSMIANPTSGMQTNIWWYRPKPYLQTITSIGFSQNGLLQWIILFTHLLRKTLMIFGTITLDIHPRMHFILLLLMLLVCLLLLYWVTILPVKAVP